MEEETLETSSASVSSSPKVERPTERATFERCECLVSRRESEARLEEEVEENPDGEDSLLIPDGEESFLVEA